MKINTRFYFDVRVDISPVQKCNFLLQVYHCEDGAQTFQYMSGSVDQGGLLCVLSDPVVCYKDSNFVQTQVK